MLRLWFSLTVILSVIRPSLSTCYLRNGTDVNSSDYQPCDNRPGAVSMCCATGRAINMRDLCLPSGLCAGGPDADTGARVIWRESCTDPTWQHPACQKICDQGDNSSGDAQITLCPDQTVCCGINNFTCCMTPAAIKFDVFSSANSTSITSANTSVSPSPSTSGSTPYGTIAAIILGSLIALIALLSAALYVLKRQKNKRQAKLPFAHDTKKGLSDPSPQMAYDPIQRTYSPHKPSGFIPERPLQPLLSQPDRQELPGIYNAHELQ